MSIRQEDNLKTLIQERKIVLDGNSFYEFINFCQGEGMGEALSASGWNTTKLTEDGITAVTVMLSPIESDKKEFALDVGDYVVFGPQYVDGREHIVFEINKDLIHAVDIASGELKVIPVDALSSMIKQKEISVMSGDKHSAKIRSRVFKI